MPRLLKHIDAIAREKQRGVLYITFHPGSFFDESATSYHWQEDPVREMICTWLTEHNLPWESCAEIANENLMISHRGQIYLDIPYDESNPDYILACDYLEDSEGNCRFDPVAWWYLSLEVAMQNAHHDEPGFWEQWAEDF